MTEKDVLKKLNVLRDIKPAAEWKSSARDILSAQVFNSSEAVKISLFDEAVFEIRSFFSFFAQPAFAAIGLFVLLVGSVFGANAARNTKPGDSFYAARVWTQKARVAITFDSRAKAKLEMKYASVRAKEISKVLSESSLNADNESDKKKIAKLTDNLKAEIKTVTDKYDEISKSDETESSEPVNVNTTSSSADADGDDVAVGIGRPSVDDGQVFAVDSSKDSKGIQISQPAAIKAEPAPVSATSSVSLTAVATSTGSDFKKNLSDAVDLVDNNDFAGAKNILDQVDTMIDSIDRADQGEVKGVSETATTVSEAIGIGTVSSSQETK